MRAKLMVLPLLAAVAVSCGDDSTQDGLCRSWVEVLPSGSGYYVQGFTLYEDGRAASVGMETLKYSSWRKDGDSCIVLSGESIGNGQTIAFDDTVRLVSLGKDTLVIGRNGMPEHSYVDGNSMDIRAMITSRPDMETISTMFSSGSDKFDLVFYPFGAVRVKHGETREVLFQYVTASGYGYANSRCDLRGKGTEAVLTMGDREYKLTEMTDEEIHEDLYNSSAVVRNGDEAVDFTAERYAGGTVTLSEFRGKVVHLAFWGSWCPPCLRELKFDNLPVLLEPFMNDSDYVFIPVAQDERKALARFFAAKGKEYMWLTDRTVIDGDRSIFHSYADSGIPRSVIIGRDGKVVATVIGSGEYEMKLITATLEELLQD